MTSKNPITDLLRFDLLEITSESFIQFHWDNDGDKNGLFTKFYEQIEAYTIRYDSFETPLYFGHFEFFEPKKGKLEIVDGTQRLISLLVILENILSKLKSETQLEGSLALIDERISRHFPLKDSKRKEVQESNDYLRREFKHKDPAFLIRLFNTIDNATFSQRIITNKEQKFQIQSNLVRFNSEPSNLKKFESFCYNSALKSDKEHRDWILNRFDTDFKFLHSRFDAIKFAVSEDDLFEITARCNDNCLLNGVVERNLDWFESLGAFKFKYDFIDELLRTINALNEFFNHGPNTSMVIHEYVSFNYYKITLPIIVKAYMSHTPLEKIISLTKSLLKIAFRHEVIGVYNSLGHRLFAHFLPTSNYSNSVKGFIETIQSLSKGKESSFMSHWSNSNFKKALDRRIFKDHQKFMLWVYENALRKDNELDPLYYDDLAQFDVVNINEEESFRDKMNTLGNLLLIHKEQKDLPSKEFFKSLSLLTQQKEVVELMEDGAIWSEEMLKQRHEKVKGVIYNKFK